MNVNPLYIEIDVPQGSSEWLQLRKTKIGSSDSAAIMEKSKWDTPYTTWARKLGLLPEKQETEAMKRGKMLESIAREDFIKKTGILMIPKVFVKEFMIASLDGVDFDNQYAVEIKCPNKEDHQIAIDGEIPDHYKYQLYHQMMVLNIPMIFYFSYTDESQALVEFKFNQEKIENLYAKEKEFYKCLMNLEPPSFTEKDHIERSDLEWIEQSRRYLEMVKKRKVIELEEQLIKQQLIELSGNMNCQGGGIKLSRVLKKGSIKYSDIPNSELQHIDLEKYRSPHSTYWKFH